MDTSTPAPLVNANLMKRYMGRRVRTVLNIVQLGHGEARGQSPDGAQVVVKLKQGTSFGGKFVEVFGVVEADGVIREESFTNFGETFDMNTYNQLCVLANGEYQHLFL
eukprot:jgi/Mesen1/3974/ME000210S03218